MFSPLRAHHVNVASTKQHACFDRISSAMFACRRHQCSAFYSRGSLDDCVGCDFRCGCAAATSLAEASKRKRRGKLTHLPSRHRRCTPPRLSDEVAHAERTPPKGGPFRSSATRSHTPKGLASEASSSRRPLVAAPMYVLIDRQNACARARHGYHSTFS